MKTLVAWLQDQLVVALTRALASTRHCPPCLRTPAGTRFFVRSLFSALFIACLIHAWHGLVQPVDLPLRAVIGNVVSWTASPAGPAGNLSGASTPLRNFALIKLGSERFRSHYQGNSPLDRCALLQDLGGVLASKTLQLLAIDLDLSPSTQRAQRNNAGDACSCDARLDQLMIDNARRVLLILPLDRHRLRDDSGPAEAIELAAQQTWLKKMKAGQVEFARPELDLQFGMVRQHVLQFEPQPTPDLTPAPGMQPKPEPGLGVATAQAICAMDRTTPSLMRYCAGVQALGRVAEGDARQISLHLLVNQLPLHNRLLLSAQTGPSLDQQEIRYALLGASYSPDDEPLTPIGRLAGMEVHAAIAANPNEAESHWLGLLIDVMLGIGFAYFVHFFWRRYFKQRLAGAAQQVSALGHPLLAYRWLVLLLALSLVLLLLLGWASAWALAGNLPWAENGLWISPAAMLVGILIDAFVVGGVHTAEQLLLRDAAPCPAAAVTGRPETAPSAAEQGAPHSPGCYWAGWQGLYRRPLAWLPSLVWLAAVLLAVRQLAH